MRRVLGLAVAIALAGCFLSKSNPTGATSSDEVIAEEVDVLASTLILDTGCSATKVGPKHLLFAARCVDDRIAPGKSIGFSTTSKEGRVTIAEVHVHASYASKCVADACGFNTVAASSARDIAVLVLDIGLEGIPTIPIDLDAVGQSDELIAIASACDRFDRSVTSTIGSYDTVAVPARTVNHDGSPYKNQPQYATRLDASYVVTAGHGWRANEPHVCKRDIGAAIFRRSGTVLVVGVTSNFSAYSDEPLVPVTLHHTRVDAKSKVSPWLASLGVETAHSCDGECPRHDYDGGVPRRESTDDTPPRDAGRIEDAASLPEPEFEPEPDVTPTPRPRPPPKPPANTPTKNVSIASCSATPGPISGFPLIAAAALTALRRRRR